MRNAIVLFGIGLIGFACSSDDNVTAISINGTYEGTFHRESPNTNWEGAMVKISFADGTFVGESDQPNYPAICEGTYSIMGDNIVFSNSCAWTTEFDASFILDGEYEIRKTADALSISKLYEGQMHDVYALTLE